MIDMWIVNFMRKYKRRLKGVFIIALLCVLMFSAAAHAHRPYLVKEGTLADPSGQIVLKGKLYGDGIFSTDPVTFELRNRYGAVLANTPVADHVAVFCPHASFCWAFPYGPTNPFVSGYKLDSENIDWEAGSQHDNERESLRRYLNDSNEKILHDYDLNYPEFTKDHSGFIEVKKALVISPILILFDKFFVLLFLFVLTIVPFFLYWLFFRKKWTSNGHLKRMILVFGGMVMLGYSFCYCIVLVIIGFTFSTPVLCVLVAVICALTLGSGFLNKTNRLNSAG